MPEKIFDTHKVRSEKKRKRYIKKRGNVEIQFNWVYVLVVGSLLLLFFVSIVNKSKESSDTKLNFKVANSLSTIFSSLSVTSDATELIDIPDTKITIDCGIYGVGSIYKNLKISNVFAPSSVEGESLLTWSKTWKLPYKVANFVYITSPEYRYVFVGEGGFVESIYAELPPREIRTQENQKERAFNKEITPEWNDIEDLHNYRTKIIFHNNKPAMPPALKDIKDDLVYAMSIYGSKEYGSVIFYGKEGNAFSEKWEVPYVGEAALYAAIFMDDGADYICAMEQAFRSFESVSDIYNERESMIKQFYEDQDHYCKAYHFTDNTLAIKQEAEKGVLDIENQLLQDKINSLERQNQQALLESCAQIY